MKLELTEKEIKYITELLDDERSFRSDDAKGFEGFADKLFNKINSQMVKSTATKLPKKKLKLENILKEIL